VAVSIPALTKIDTATDPEIALTVDFENGTWREDAPARHVRQFYGSDTIINAVWFKSADNDTWPRV
jgi:hypothetical protein